MGLRSFLIAIVGLFVGFSAFADNLDEARRLSDQIKAMTGVEIINPNASGIFYSPEGIQNLNLALERLSKRNDLRGLQPYQVGPMIVEELNYAFHLNDNGYVSNTQGNTDYAKLDAEVKFCKLAAEPCNLFSPRVATAVCRVQPDLAKGLLVGF